MKDREDREREERERERERENLEKTVSESICALKHGASKSRAVRGAKSPFLREDYKHFSAMRSFLVGRCEI